MKTRSLKALSVLFLVVAVFLGTRELYNKKEQKQSVGENNVVSKASIGAKPVTRSSSASTKVHVVMTGFTAGFADENENKQNQ